MKIIAHRGYWKNIREINSKIAFKKACLLGFGIETDVRDYRGSVVISHDIVKEETLSLEKFLQIYIECSEKLSPIALNIKSDGLVHLLDELLKKYNIKDYFVFDMSIPEMLQYAHRGLRFFTRQSEYELEPVLLDKACGVWLDEFQRHWITDEVLVRYFNQGKNICIVSPELHQRSYKQEWDDYLSFISKFDSELLILCTDRPEEARRFFYGK